MTTLYLKAPAKVNLTLNVLGKRPDGYHDLQTIMHEIPLYDLITLRIGIGEGIDVKSNLRYIRPEKNIGLKAAEAFFAASGIETPGVRIDMKKVIPVGAGLGGGSADAAAILFALNRHYEAPLDKDSLFSLGASLGADIPFCLHGGCALAEGIGDRLTPIPSLPPCYMLVVKPPFPISTGALFRALGEGSIKEHPDSDAVISALKARDIYAVARGLGNSLTAPATALHKTIGEIIEALLLAGAAGASMSGSGSAVFALFTEWNAASLAYDIFKARYRQVFLVCPGHTSSL